MARISSFRETGERYAVLRVLATICGGLGYFFLTLSAVALIGGIGSYLVQLAGPSNGFFIGVALVWALGLFVAGIQFLGTASLFRLAIHVEENTRATAQALDRLTIRMEQKPEVDPRSIFLS
jgi:hypothetical protein